MLATESECYSPHVHTLILRLLQVLQPLYFPGTPTILIVHIMRQDAEWNGEII